MYYVFVLFIGCYRANLQNILRCFHLSEAAVSTCVAMALH